MGDVDERRPEKSFHEAGHCVAAVVLSIPIKSIRMVPDESGKTVWWSLRSSPMGVTTQQWPLLGSMSMPELPCAKGSVAQNRSLPVRAMGRVEHTPLTPRFRNRWPEAPTALTAFGHSPAQGRSQQGRGENVRAEAIAPALRDPVRRIGSSGSAWRYWGYYAGRGRAHQGRARVSARRVSIVMCRPALCGRRENSCRT